jgi:UDP-glucuronate 4-epimerase
MKILVTGAAGFIGFHLSKLLLSKGHFVVGIDNINDYYDVNLKYDRLNELGIKRNESEVFLNSAKGDLYGDLFKFVRINLEDRDNLPKLFKENKFDVVCNLAAQAGVRYSIENPQAYIDSNIQGFINILECCREFNVRKLVYASSSSVYGNSNNVPFNETQNVDNPISLYAATKKSNELMAHTYSHLYNIQTIGLRFFTVYGPWGRPDMAMFLFTDAILNDKPINVFNKGNLSRDFTYIDDIVQRVFSTITEKSKENGIYQLYNIGNNSPVKLIEFISEIEKAIGKKAIRKMMPMQPGDVKKTWADVSLLMKNYNNIESTNIEEGIRNFVNWYIKYYKK